MSQFKIAIPSYKRAEILRDKTLKVLESYDIDPSIVTIFVANDEEKVHYTNVLSSNKYASNIVVGVEGLGPVRNWISREYYDEGEYIVNMDDDIIEIQKFVSKKEKLSRVENFVKEVIEPGFKACEENNAYLWGVYAAANSFYMDERIVKGLYYIIGSLWGNINRHSEDLVLTLEDKEDFERTLQYYDKDGLVIRNNSITVETEYYAHSGGMFVTRTEERITKSAENLVARYPEYCSMYFRKTTGHAELKLRGKVKPPKASIVTMDDFF